MDNEEGKQTPRRVSSADLEQVESDRAMAMAMALQEQERAASALTTTLPDIIGDGNYEEESEEFSSEEDEEEEDYDSNDYEFFQSSQEIEAAELEFLEGEGSSDEDIMEEDDVDVDGLSYEELIALGEFIGEEKRGMPVKEISRCLREFKCRLSTDQKERVDVDRCVVCQFEFEEDEALVALPCEHPFHLECISKWLQIKKVCPICSTEISSPGAASPRD